MALPQALGVVMMRWFGEGKRVVADRIEQLHDGQLHLESGARVPVSDETLATGPSRTGDYYVRDEDGAEKLMAGADFVTKFSPIPHAYDAAAVSPDIQPGGGGDVPSSGSPDDPLTKEPAANDTTQTVAPIELGAPAPKFGGEAEREPVVAEGERSDVAPDGERHEG